MSAANEDQLRKLAAVKLATEKTNLEFSTRLEAKVAMESGPPKSAPAAVLRTRSFKAPKSMISKASGHACSVSSNTVPSSSASPHPASSYPLDSLHPRARSSSHPAASNVPQRPALPALYISGTRKLETKRR
jgi:hypothetical protein